MQIGICTSMLTMCLCGFWYTELFENIVNLIIKQFCIARVWKKKKCIYLLKSKGILRNNRDSSTFWTQFAYWRFLIGKIILVFSVQRRDSNTTLGKYRGNSKNSWLVKIKSSKTASVFFFYRGLNARVAVVYDIFVENRRFTW